MIKNWQKLFYLIYDPQKQMFEFDLNKYAKIEHVRELIIGLQWRRNSKGEYNKEGWNVLGLYKEIEYSKSILHKEIRTREFGDPIEIISITYEDIRKKNIQLIHNPFPLQLPIEYSLQLTNNILKKSK